MPSTRQNPSNPLPLLGDYTVAEFLLQFWQQQPLLIPAALPDFTSPLLPEELAGLACDEDSESLLILEKHGPTPWFVEHGPFTEQRFAHLPETHLSLLVHGVDQKVPAVHALKQRFSFIPHWRMDDVMVSYATPHGSVGPHRDQYDVFLLQAMGRRRWQINRDTRLPVAKNPPTELDLLEPFEPEDEWILEPGDMLYLPPGVAHHGVALEACMTFSIGFRAPSQAEIVSAWADELTDSLNDTSRYRDAEIDIGHPGEITASVLHRLVNNIGRQMESNSSLVTSFGKLITQPKRGIAEHSINHKLTSKELIERLRQGESLIHHPATRFAYWLNPDASGLIFCDGEVAPFDRHTNTAVRALCNQSRFDYDELAVYLNNAAFLEMLTDYINLGKLCFHDDVWI